MVCELFIIWPARLQQAVGPYSKRLAVYFLTSNLQIGPLHKLWRMPVPIGVGMLPHDFIACVKRRV